jgi:hypothetical protein
MTEEIESSQVTLIDPAQIDRETVDFVLNRNSESMEPPAYYLLTASYSLQFPARLRSVATEELDDEEPFDEAHDELMREPEETADYWLDGDAIIESLSFLDPVAIYEDLKRNRPFITVESLKDAVKQCYAREFLAGWAEIEYVHEYLDRFFNGLDEGVLNLGTEVYYQIKRNKFKQLIIEH